jgi:hypothetical protein
VLVLVVLVVNVQVFMKYGLVCVAVTVSLSD